MVATVEEGSCFPVREYVVLPEESTGNCGNVVFSEEEGDVVCWMIGAAFDWARCPLCLLVLDIFRTSKSFWLPIPLEEADIKEPVGALVGSKSEVWGNADEAMVQYIGGDGRIGGKIGDLDRKKKKGRGAAAIDECRGQDMQQRGPSTAMVS